MSEDAIKVTKEQASKAFGLLVQAMDAALIGKFPVGLDHIEKHMEIKGALQVVGAALKEQYEGKPDLKVVEDKKDE